MRKKTWDNLIKKALIQMGFRILHTEFLDEDLNLILLDDDYIIGKHILFSNLIFYMKLEHKTIELNQEIILEFYHLKEKILKKGNVILPIFANYNGFTAEAREIAIEKGILLLTKYDEYNLQKILNEINIMQYYFLAESPQERVPNISGTENFEFFDRIDEMLNILLIINKENPPITSKKILEYLKRNQKFLEVHNQLREQGKFTFYQDYKKLFRQILNLIDQEKIGNKINLLLTNEFQNYLNLSRKNQKIYFLLHLLKYKGFQNYLLLHVNAKPLVKTLRNQVEVSNFQRWLKYLGIEDFDYNMKTLLTCSNILNDSQNIDSKVCLGIQKSITEILSNLIQ